MDINVVIITTLLSLLGFFLNNTLKDVKNEIKGLRTDLKELDKFLGEELSDLKDRVLILEGKLKHFYHGSEKES